MSIVNNPFIFSSFGGVGLFLAMWDSCPLVSGILLSSRNSINSLICRSLAYLKVLSINEIICNKIMYKCWSMTAVQWCLVQDFDVTCIRVPWSVALPYFFSFFLRTLIYSSSKILQNLCLSEFGLSSHCNVVAQEVLCIWKRVFCESVRFLRFYWRFIVIFIPNYY